MVKKIVVTLPPHLKKFFLYEYNGEIKKNGIAHIHIDKHSEMGKLVHLISRPIPFTQKWEKEKAKAPGGLTISYYVHVHSWEIPEDKIEALEAYMDEMFRRSLISEVRGAHDLTGAAYGKLVTSFLKRRGIERDIDVDSETMRKVYRDYIGKNNRKMKKIYA